MQGDGTTGGDGRRRFVVVAALIVALLSAMTGAVWYGTRPADEETDTADAPDRDGRGAHVRPGAGRVKSGADGVRTAHARPRARGEDVSVPAEEQNAIVHLPGTDASGAANAPSVDAVAAADGVGGADPSGVRAGAVSSKRTRAGGAAGMTDLQASVAVRVTAAESGEPVRDAVAVFTLRDAPPRDLVTDGNGRAVFFAPVGASAVLEVKARGRFRERRDPLVVSSAETTVDIVLTRGVVVRGTVTGPNGPVRGARIRAVDHAALLASLPYAPEPRALETTTTDRSGAYWLDCIPRGVACVLIVEADGLAPRMAKLEAQPDVEYATRMDLLLTAASHFEGIVRDTDGRPVAGAWANAVPSERLAWLGFRAYADAKDIDELAMLDGLRSAARGEGGLPFRARTDDAGRFRIAVSGEDADWTLLAMHATKGRSPPSGRVRAGRGLADLVLRGRVRAEFELLTASGKLAEGMTLAPYLPWERWSVAPKAPGRYGDADMEAGPIALIVSGAAGAPGIYVGRRTNSKQPLWSGQLKDPAVWRGTVVDDRRLPVVGARVAAGPVSATSAEHGEFKIEGVHPVETQLTAVADGHPEIRMRVDTARRDGIAVRLPRDAPLRLRLNLPAGALAPTWYRVWTVDSKGYARSVWEDRFVWNDGEIAIADVESHDDLLAVFVPGYPVVVRTIRAVPGEATDLGTIQLEPPRRVAGTVVDESGQPVPYASVCVRPTDRSSWQRFLPERWIDSDASGSFLADIVAPDQICEVVATATGFATTPQALPAAPGVPYAVVIGRGFEIRGRWLTHDGKPTVVRLLGPGETVYATIPLTRDGTFEATVPRRPRAVVLLDATKRDDAARATMDVPATFPDGDVLLIP